MTDIQIIGAIQDGPWIRIQRTLDGLGDSERMPRETLALRAAEYDLEIEDPRALDIMLLERFYIPEDPEETHPLFRMDTVTEALAEVERRIEVVQIAHGAPTEPVMRSLSSAADTGRATNGLVVAKNLLIQHAPRNIAWAVQHQRDIGRAHQQYMRTRPPAQKPMGQRLKEHSLGILQAEAIDINTSMNR